MLEEKFRSEIKERLEIMNIMGSARKQMLNGDIGIWERQNSLFRAVYYSLKLNLGSEEYDHLKEQIEAFEKEQKGHSKVYMVQKRYTEFGPLTALFFVDDRENWEIEKNDLSEGYAFVYVINEENPIFNEFGSVAIGKAMGGIYII